MDLYQGPPPAPAAKRKAQRPPVLGGEGGRGTERLLLTWESQRADSRVVTVPPRGCRDPQLQFICVWGLKEPQLSSLP